MSTLQPMIFESDEYEYLRRIDNALDKIISHCGVPNRHYMPDCFEALVSSIVAQQLSAKAADKVWLRVEETCGGNVTPKNILALENDALRAAGLSYSKVSYSKNIAEAAQAGMLNRKTLLTLSDEEIIERLIKIKGVGRWTAEMFLIFSLCRKDVMSLGDFGIRRGLTLLYFPGQTPSLSELTELSAKFSPCRTLASLYLWEVNAALLSQLQA